MLRLQVILLLVITGCQSWGKFWQSGDVSCSQQLCFAGLKSATANNAGTQITLAWPSASSSTTPASNLVYQICQSTAQGICRSNFTATYTSDLGATTYTISSVAANTLYYFVARVQDTAGNSDANDVEKVSGNVWITRAAAPTARDNIGGGDCNASGSTLIEEYNPTTNSWTTKVGTGCSTARSCGGAVSLNNKLYIMGGYPNGQNTMDAYDPVADSCTAKTNMPGINNQMAVVSLLGKLRVLGGEFTANWEYNEAGNSWGTNAAIPPGSGQYRCLSAAAVNAKIYIFGGATVFTCSSIVADTFEYDPANDGAGWIARSAMLSPNYRARAVVVNGRIYNVGGSPGQRVEEFDPLANTWSVRANIPTARGVPVVAQVNGVIYVIGGGGLTNNEMYVPPNL
jgi:hypothetical protein